MSLNKLFSVIVTIIILSTSSTLYSFDYYTSTKAIGMGGAYSLAGDDNGLITGNPAGVADSHKLSLSGLYSRTNDNLNTSYVNLSMIDSALNPNLAGGLTYTRFFNDGEESNKIKLEDIYFELAEHYTDYTYIGIGVRRIRNFNPYEKNYDLNFGVIVKFNNNFSLGAAGYNLLKYQCPFFQREAEFSAAFNIMDMVKGEVDWLQNIETTDWNQENAIIKGGLTVIILEQIGIQAGYNYAFANNGNSYSGGISWDFPQGGIGYAIKYNNDSSFSHVFMLQYHPELY